MRKLTFCCAPFLYVENDHLPRQARDKRNETADKRRPSAGGWNGNRSDYTTAVVGNMSISWLKKVIPGAKAAGKPFMAYIAPKACHEPFTPATWYAEHWAPAWPAQVR